MELDSTRSHTRETKRSSRAAQCDGAAPRLWETCLWGWLGVPVTELDRPECELAQRGLDLGDAAFFLAQQQSRGDSAFGGEQQQAQDGFATLLGLDEPGDNAAIQKLQRLRAAYNPDGALLYRV